MITVWTGPIINMGATRPLVFLYGSAGGVVTPPSQRGDIDYDQTKASARRGDGPQFQMAGLGTVIPGHVPVYDSQLNLIDSGTTPGGGGSGTVTSVALTVPSRQTVTGSPITTAGTLAITDNTESANLVFAGPSSGSAAAPTFRALVAADVPSSYPAPLTLTASSSATLDFTPSNIIAVGSFTDYQFRFRNLVPATTNSTFQMLVSSDGGSTWKNSNYSYSGFATAAPSGSAGFGGSAASSFQLSFAGVISTAAKGLSAVMTVLTMGSTSWLSYQLIENEINNDGTIRQSEASGFYTGGIAINAIRFQFSSGSISAGSITCQPLPQ